MRIHLEFINSNSDNVAINDGHGIKRPIRSKTDDKSINIGQMFHDSQKKLINKSPIVKIWSKLLSIKGKNLFNSFFWLTEKIPLVQGLDGNRTSEMAIGHN